MGDYQQYHYEMFDLYPEHPLKMISQQLYDHAAEHGPGPFSLAAKKYLG